MKTRIHTPRRQRKPRCARGGALRALVAAALVAECMHACQIGEIIVICDASHARNHHHLHPQKLLMLRPKAFWVCGRMARRLVGAVVPRSVHANLNMGLFLRAKSCRDLHVAFTSQRRLLQPTRVKHQPGCCAALAPSRAAQKHPPSRPGTTLCFVVFVFRLL